MSCAKKQFPQRSASVRRKEAHLVVKVPVPKEDYKQGCDDDKAINGRQTQRQLAVPSQVQTLDSRRWTSPAQSRLWGSDGGHDACRSHRLVPMPNIRGKPETMVFRIPLRAFPSLSGHAHLVTTELPSKQMPVDTRKASGLGFWATLSINCMVYFSV